MGSQPCLAWLGASRRAHQVGLAPRGWCATSSTKARRPRSGSVQGLMAPSHWYGMTWASLALPAQSLVSPQLWPQPHCALAGLWGGFLLLGCCRAASGHPRHPSSGRLHLHGARLGGTAHPGDSPSAGDGTHCPMGAAAGHLYSVSLPTHCQIWVVGGEHPATGWGSAWLHRPAWLHPTGPFSPQLSLFFDIVLCMARGMTEKDFVKGGGDASARSARSVLWTALRAFPLSMGE